MDKFDIFLALVLVFFLGLMVAVTVHESKAKGHCEALGMEYWKSDDGAVCIKPEAIYREKANP